MLSAPLNVRVRDFPKRGYLFPVWGVPVSQVVCLCPGCLPGSRVRPAPPPSSPSPSPPPPPPPSMGWEGGWDMVAQWWGALPPKPAGMSAANQTASLVADPPLYAPYMCHICAIYAPYMRLICAIYAPYMRLICAIYAPYMRLLCSNLAT